MTSSEDFNSLARILKNAVPDLQTNHDPVYTAAILMTYARLWNDKDNFDHIDECSSLKSLYRTALGVIAGGIHPENQEKAIQWTLSHTSSTAAAPDIAPRVQDFVNHAQDMMDCLYDIGHCERFPTDSPPSPAEYFNLCSTQTKYATAVPMHNGYNCWIIPPSAFPPQHVGCGLATPTIVTQKISNNYTCLACQELNNDSGGENQQAHMIPGGCLYEDSNDSNHFQCA